MSSTAAAPHIIDIHSLFETWARRCAESSLTYDYGPVKKLQSDCSSWDIRSGTEYVVSSPVDIDNVESVIAVTIRNAKIVDAHQHNQVSSGRPSQDSRPSHNVLADLAPHGAEDIGTGEEIPTTTLAGCRTTLTKEDPILIGETEGDIGVHGSEREFVVIVPWDSIDGILCENGDEDREMGRRSTQKGRYPEYLEVYSSFETFDPELYERNSSCLIIENDRVRPRPPLVITLTISGADLLCVVSFGVDLHMRGFEFHFASGSRRWTQSIGYYRSVMKYLNLEPGKEFIISYYVTRSMHHPCRVIGLRFLTNWGHQLIVGEPGQDETRYPSKESQPFKDNSNVCLVGIDWEWLDEGRKLDEFGIFYRDLPKLEPGDEVCGKGVLEIFDLDDLDDTGKNQRELKHAHYRYSEWNVGESFFQGLRIWITQDDVLIGLQFVAENGSESPRWEYCEAEKPIEVELKLNPTVDDLRAESVLFCDKIDPGMMISTVDLQLIGFELPAARRKEDQARFGLWCG
ncbi:hypothetical protein FGRMN_10163 [Fusarium graminum]|nr:hypothetical protein FGRMN_10163 [Fusarium graminum]